MNVILCVSNDVITDRRVARTACSLMKIFDGVTVIGRFIPGTIDLPSFPYRVKRMKLIFRRNFLFYAEYNIRLFFYLLFQNPDVIAANDLDTLPAAYAAARLRSCKLVYDSHEFFTEVPELQNRPFVRNFWKRIEKLLLPSVKNCYTVSDSIAKMYNEIYGVRMRVVRNLPYRIKNNRVTGKVGGKGRVLIYQGSLNEGRGLELAIRTLEFMKNTRLLIVGTGDIEKELRQLVGRLKLENRVEFAGRVAPADLPEFASRADAGISLERPEGLNYTYALPNKLFDYIQSGLPVIVSDLPEMAGLVRNYGAGLVTGTDDPEILACEIDSFLKNEALIAAVRQNLEVAAEELCWEREENKLLDIYRSL